MGKTNIIFDLPVSPWIVGALALLVLAAVIVWTVRDLARIKLFTRIAVIVLTIAGTLLAIGLLLNPRLVREWPDPQKPMLCILADDSRSMSLTDSYKGRRGGLHPQRAGPDARRAGRRSRPRGHRTLPAEPGAGRRGSPT